MCVKLNMRRSRTNSLAVSGLLFLALVACSESSSDVLRRANASLAANEPGRAEQILREGIISHPKEKELTHALLRLYNSTKQWEKLENYLAIAPRHDDYIISTFYNQLATHHFNEKNWDRARDLYFTAADLQVSVWVLMGSCPREGVWATYRNAAAAASNARDANGVRRAVKEIEELRKAPICSDSSITTKNAQSELDKHLEEINGWLR